MTAGWRFNTNKLNGSCQIHAVANTGNVIVVGNSTVSNLCVNSTSGEIISGAHIKRISWGTDTNWQVLRGTNLIMVLTGTSEIVGDGIPIVLDPTANISATTTSANSFIILEIQKTFSSY